MATVKELRQEAGLTQAQLADRAGVSRQLIGAVEAGRHQPRVDAAIALAGALEVSVEQLFAVTVAPVDAISGEPPADGSLVRLGRVGELAVTAPTRLGTDGWDVADGLVDRGEVAPFATRPPGIVVAGCEPGLDVLERLLRESGMAALSVSASSSASLEALAAGRVHAAVVHGVDPHSYELPVGVEVDRYHLTRWQVGLAGPPGATGSWWQPVLMGRAPVVQRETSAGVQRTFERSAVRPDIEGPRVASHLEAARTGAIAGLAAVTIQPAALAVGVPFHPLETHDAELWISRQWGSERPVLAALNVIDGQGFQRRLTGVGGYDLSGIGTRIP